jgi:hypothetical protein
MSYSIKETFNNYYNKNPIFTIYIIYVIICTIIAIIVYFGLDTQKLTYEKYLEIIKNYGIDTSNPEIALKETEKIVNSFKIKLQEEYNKGYRSAPPCGLCLGYRSYYRCCENKRTSYAQRQKNKYYNELLDKDKELISAYNNYNNLKLYDIIKGYFFAIIGIPLILLLISSGAYIY